MLVGNGTPPKGAITGEGLASVLKIAGQTIRFDETKNRIRLEK